MVHQILVGVIFVGLVFLQCRNIRIQEQHYFIFIIHRPIYYGANKPTPRIKIHRRHINLFQCCFRYTRQSGHIRIQKRDDRVYHYFIQRRRRQIKSPCRIIVFIRLAPATGTLICKSHTVCIKQFTRQHIRTAVITNLIICIPGQQLLNLVKDIMRNYGLMLARGTYTGRTAFYHTDINLVPQDAMQRMFGQWLPAPV